MKHAKSRKLKLSRIFSIFFLVLFALSFPYPAGAEFVQAPGFSEVDIQGNRQSLEQYRGKFVVLYFWATWCSWCRKDTKAMIEVFKTYHPKGVEFISVSLDQDLAKLQKFVNEHHVPYPVIFEGEGWENKIVQLYGIEATPSFILIDPQGQVRSGGGSSEELKEELAQFR
ncbi:MAG: TlpA family protein disulfide reductase [Candidatus Omnitrophica bacterium]|nr:TlpA family protein disulfide reductase [Candidatus Omnitrophota bacterium]